MSSGTSAVNAWPASATARSKPCSAMNRTSQSRPNPSGAVTSRPARPARWRASTPWPSRSPPSAIGSLSCVMPALRPAPAGSVRQAPDLEELESEGLHALEDPVELGMVADAAVQDGLDALGVALERVEAGEQGGAETTADAELVLRRGHDGKLPRRRGDDGSPTRVIGRPPRGRRTGSPGRARRAHPGPPDDRAPQRKERRYGDLSGGRPVGREPRHDRGTDRLLVDVARDGRDLDHRRPRRAAV